MNEEQKGNPQIEDGYTRIANELMEALSKAMCNGTIVGKEAGVLLWIIRETYGYQKPTNFFKTSYLAKQLNLSQSWIDQLLSKLVKKNIIIRNGDEMGLNKHYLEWKILDTPKKILDTTKILDTSKEILDTSKEILDTSKISSSINIEDKKICDVPKENYIKKNIKKTTISYENEKFQNITEEKIQKWKEAYPNQNIEVELKKMESWLAANPNKQKKNYERFIVNWLSRAEQNYKKGGNKDGRYIPINYGESNGETEIRIVKK